MTKDKAAVAARLAEAETAFMTLCRAERQPFLADSEAQFRAQLVAFMALAQSCVSLVELDKLSIDAITKRWPDQNDQSLFQWFRKTRNESLKEGRTSALKVRHEMITEAEFASRFPGAAGYDPANRQGLSRTSHSGPPVMVAVNVFELEIKGAIVPATAACKQYLKLVHRFLREPEVFGSTF